MMTSFKYRKHQAHGSLLFHLTPENLTCFTSLMLGLAPVLRFKSTVSLKLAHVGAKCVYTAPPSPKLLYMSAHMEM